MLNNVKQQFLLFHVKVRGGELMLYNAGQLQKLQVGLSDWAGSTLRPFLRLSEVSITSCQTTPMLNVKYILICFHQCSFYTICLGPSLCQRKNVSITHIQ